MKYTSRQRRLLSEAGEELDSIPDERPRSRRERPPEGDDELSLDLDMPDENPERDKLGAVNSDGVDRQSDLESMRNGLKSIALLKKAISMLTAAKMIVSSPKKSGGLGRTDLAPQEGMQLSQPGSSPQQWLPTIPSIEQQINTVIEQISHDLSAIANKTQETEAKQIFNDFFNLSDIDAELDTPGISPNIESIDRIIDDIGLTESERYQLYGALNSLLVEVAASTGGIAMGNASFFGVAAQDEKSETPSLFRKSDKKPYSTKSTRWYLPPTAGKKTPKNEIKRTI